VSRCAITQMKQSTVTVKSLIYLSVVAHSFVFIYLFIYLFRVFRDRVFLCSPGCPGTHFVDQAGLELRHPPASASQVLGLKAWATTPVLFIYLFTLHLSNALLPVTPSHNPSRLLSSILSSGWVGRPWVSLPTLALQVSVRLGASSPTEARQGRPARTCPMYRQQLLGQPLSSCSGPTWRPSCTSATYEQGDLGPTPLIPVPEAEEGGSVSSRIAWFT
jgi:hypothetical protein